MTKIGIVIGLIGTLATSCGTMAAPLPNSYGGAKWIWSDDQVNVRDSYRLFRKTFSIARKPSKALIKITADSEYRLFVNGAYVGRGPAPNPPSNICLDTQDISGFLKTGNNTIGVIVYHLGIPSFPRIQDKAGFFASLTLPNATVVSDASWRTRKAWWTPTDMKFSPFREYCECLNGADEPIGWTESTFDDKAWGNAVELGEANVAPWTAFSERDIPLPYHRMTTPNSILFTSVPEKEPTTQKATPPMLASLPKGTGPDSLHPESLLLPRGLLMNGTGVGIAVAVDFGGEVSGYPEFSFNSRADGVLVDVGYGEGLDKNGHISVMRQGNPDADRFILRKGSQTLRIFHHRAFRYMVIYVHGGITEVKTPVVVESGYPVTFAGSFNSSDARLNQIWSVGRRTMQICMDQGFMDCPWRERGQYIGDGLAEGAVAQYAFGDTTLMRRFLRQAQYVQPEDGMLEPAYPCDWIALAGARGPNRIPGYGALWVVMLSEYAKNTGDTALLNELWPVVKKQLGWFDKYRKSDGSLGPVPEWNFIDWANLKAESNLTCLNLQYWMSLMAGHEIGRIIKMPNDYASIASKLKDSFVKQHWDPSRKLFKDAEGLYTQHTNALALLTVVTNQTQAEQVISSMYDADLQKPESPYFEGYVLKGLCKWGYQSKALEVIRDKWGNMIDKGATTFWESYAAEWSLCHAWSCEPVALLSRDILGVSHNALTGLTTIQPNPLDLTSANGIVPTAAGPINIGWTNDNSTLRLRLSKSDNVIFVAPSGWNVKSITVTDKSGKAETFDGKKLVKLKRGQTSIEVVKM